MSFSIKSASLLSILPLMVSLSATKVSANDFPTYSSIWPGYVGPTNQGNATIEGYIEYNLLTPSTAPGRYTKSTSMGFGLREYNAFWESYEDSGVPSQAAPFACPVNYQLVPADEPTRIAQGYHKYRCINSGAISFNSQLYAADANAGFQTVAVLWASPAIYRDPGCDSSQTGLPEACVPRDDAMDDFEDFVNFMAEQYNGKNGAGKISHFIIWNENASAAWFNYSPTVKIYGTVSASDRALWIAKYVAMMKRAYGAISRHSHGVMMDVSADGIWAAPSLTASTVSHIGTKNLLDGIWSALGTSIDWSLAVHPYGDPMTPVANATNPNLAPKFSYYNLGMVAAYQASQLAQRGVSQASTAPQAYLIASEQLPFTWTEIDSRTPHHGVRAEQLCQQHAAALKVPTLIGEDNNHLQANSAAADYNGPITKAHPNTFDSFALLPFAAGNELAKADSYPEGLAYEALNPKVWGHNNSNYCCVHTKLGCTGAANPALIKAPAAPASTFFQSSMLMNLNSGNCLDVTGGSTANGTPLQSYHCSGAPWQSFTLQSNGSLIDNHSGKCVDVTGGMNQDGAHLQIWDCNGSPQQTWFANMNMQQINGLGGRCIDIAGGSTLNGAPIDILECNQTRNQSFFPISQLPVFTDQSLVDQNSKKCLDVTGGSTANGTLLQLYDCNGSPQQHFTLSPQGALIDTHSGKCVDVIGGSNNNGAKLQIWDCNGNAQQTWSYTPLHQLIGLGGHCIDVTGASSTNGTGIQIYDCSGVMQQSFSTQP